MEILNQTIYKRVPLLRLTAAGCFAAMLWFAVSGMIAQVQKTVSKEYQVKALFLYNFSQFTEWPENSFRDPKSPVVIGIWGGNPFGNYLIETLKDEKVNGRPLVIQAFRTADDIKLCHILFLNERPGDQSEQVLDALKEKSILTVSDAPNFIKQGGMVRLFTENNKMKIQINLETAKAANLNLSSNLLRLAEIVK